MTAPIVYRWDDANAPVLTNERDSLISLLTACLVDGYDIKSGAGWTKEFDNEIGTVAAFRNSPTEGTGMFLRLDCSAVYAGGAKAIIQGYESMSAIDNGVGPINDGVSSMFYSTSPYSASPPVARPWVIISDSRCFYYFCAIDVLATTSVPLFKANLFFGDIISLSDPDPYACALFLQAHIDAPHAASWMFNAAPAPTTWQPGCFMARNRAGDNTIARVSTIFAGGPGVYLMGSVGAPFGEGLPVVLSRPFINDGTAYSLRGLAPGLYSPCHAFPYANLQRITIDGIEFIAIKTSAWVNTVQVLIAIDSNFRT